MNLLNEVSYSKFLTRKIIVNDQSNANYDVGNEIIYNTEVFCILVRGDIIIIGHAATQVTFKTCALFTKCSQKLMEQQ